MDLLATIGPLEEAVKHFGEKSAVASTLRTKDWAKVPAEISDRSFFSAGVEDARFLATAQEKILNALKLQREKVKNGEAFVDRSSFIGDMRKLALPLSDSPNPFADQGITNIASRARLGLIFDMQVQSAQGFASYKIGTDPDLLDAFPAQELVRDEQRKQPRDWLARWVDAGGPVKNLGRMAALKTDPVWAKLSRFGTPWPPFDFGSGMGLRDLSRSEAEDLGLIARDAEVQQPKQTYFNEGLSATVADLPGTFLNVLKKVFGSNVELSSDKIAWLGGAA
jgi:hypothetical protein